MKKLSAILSVILFLCLGAFYVLYLDLLKFANKPASRNSLTAIFVISPGQGFKTVSDNLHKMEVLDYPLKLRVFARLRGLDKRIRAGEYLLNSNMTPTQMLEIFINGKVMLHRVTVPEGYTQQQITALLEGSGLVSGQAFNEAIHETNLTDQMNISADSLEGYLFPDTYYFPRGVTPQTIISTMVNRFWTQFDGAWKQRADELGLSVHEVITLASIIEKEAGVASERPIISSVFHNRLEKKMRLESDPTVIYGLVDFNGNITREHLDTYTPYNTYRIRGLPPGPIANPGAAAIEAALYPADTDYLFFVAKKDRTHQFSTTILEHNRAVRKYQLRRKE